MYHKLENGVCKTCGLAVDILTVDCPGRVVTTEERTKIRLGMLDFSMNKWRTYVSLNEMYSSSTERDRETFNQ